MFLGSLQIAGTVSGKCKLRGFGVGVCNTSNWGLLGVGKPAWSVRLALCRWWQHGPRSQPARVRLLAATLLDQWPGAGFSTCQKQFLTHDWWAACKLIILCSLEVLTAGTLPKAVFDGVHWPEMGFQPKCSQCRKRLIRTTWDAKAPGKSVSVLCKPVYLSFRVITQ